LLLQEDFGLRGCWRGSMPGGFFAALITSAAPALLGLPLLVGDGARRGCGNVLIGLLA